MLSKLDEVDGELLIRSFLEDEVKAAVWDCGSSKSPRPDGFNLGFFQDCWDIIKENLLRVLDEFLDNGKLAQGCNSSFLVLIPKEGFLGLQNLRPILLISSLYKIIAKVLARRLKHVMGKILEKLNPRLLKAEIFWMASLFLTR